MISLGINPPHLKNLLKINQTLETVLERCRSEVGRSQSAQAAKASSASAAATMGAGLTGGVAAEGLMAAAAEPTAPAVAGTENSDKAQRYLRRQSSGDSTGAAVQNTSHGARMMQAARERRSIGATPGVGRAPPATKPGTSTPPRPKRKRDDAAAAELPPWPFPTEWGEAESDGDAAWWGRLRLVDVALADPVALFIASHLRKCNGWLCSVRRVQSRQLWRKYTVRARPGAVKPP